MIPSLGLVTEDGTANFTTYTADDGVPAGEYIVSAYWMDASGRSSRTCRGSDLDPTTSDHKVTIEKASTISERLS